MKKYAIKATALAIGALVGGGAYAAVTAPIVLSSTVTAEKPQTFAKELTYSATAPINPTTAATILSFQTPLGFGISGSSTRYIRVDFGNAKLVTPLAAALETDLDVGTATLAGGSSAVISAGGAAGDTYVIYQVNLGAAQGQGASASFKMKVPDLQVLSTASNVTATYSLHETGTSAVTGVGGNAQLASKSGDIATFATGLALSVGSKATSTASVDASFKSFLSTGANVVDTDSTAATSYTGVSLGTVTYGVVTTVLEHDGSPVDLADLLAAGTKMVVTGDFSVPAGSTATAQKTSAFIAAAADCSTKTGSTAATALAAGSASFTLDAGAVAGRAICYWVNGTSAIPASDYSVRVDVVAPTGVTTASLSDVAMSSIARDGTELQAPFVTIHPDYLSRIVLTSQASADAAVMFSAITEDGVTVPTINANATLKAGKQLIMNVKDIVPSLSTGTRFAIKAIIAAPKGKIEGVYNVMNYNQTTGATNSLISYQLARPAN